MGEGRKAQEGGNEEISGGEKGINKKAEEESRRGGAAKAKSGSGNATDWTGCVTTERRRRTQVHGASAKEGSAGHVTYFESPLVS